MLLRKESGANVDTSRGGKINVRIAFIQDLFSVPVFMRHMALPIHGAP